MFLNKFRTFPSTFKFIVGAVRTLTSGGPAKPIPHLRSIIASAKYSPVLSEPTLIDYERKKNILDIPVTITHRSILDVPAKVIIPFEDNSKSTVCEEPDKPIEKQATRLIVIRRKKMKRHKLKKLRLKMKFLWAKLRQKRELRKEKTFQAELMCQIKEAEKFNANLYVRQKLDKVNEVLIPKLWKGKRLPEFLIKELLEEKSQKRAKRLEDLERRQKMNLKASDYKF